MAGDVAWNGWTNDEPAIGMRVEVTPLVRSLAEDGAPGYGPLPGDAPGTVTDVYRAITTLSTKQVVMRVWVAWDEPGETTTEQSWRVADLQPATERQRSVGEPSEGPLAPTER